MAKVITFMNQKGGVAKTTSAVTMSYCLAEKGYKILFVDIDPQANGTATLLTTNKYMQIFDKNLYTLINGTHTFNEVVQKVTDNIDVIPAVLLLGKAENEWLNRGSREFLLYDMLAPVRENYDFIILDTPPHLMLLAMNAIVATDDIIIPYNADRLSLMGIRAVYSAVNPIKENPRYNNPNVGITGLLLTRYEQTKINNFMAESIKALAKEIGAKHIYNTVIHKTTKVMESLSAEKSLLEFAPECTAAKDYRAFTDEYLTLSGMPLKKKS